MKAIERVAVLGAGVMGSGIAAHLANAGMRVLLLDVVPAGAPADDRKARDRLAAAGVESALKSRAFYVPSYAQNVEVGNLDDDVARLRECDWVIEAVVEDLEVKKRLFAGKVAPNLNDGAILSSNTSGLSVEAMAAVLPPEVRRRFLVVHFFNPPRHMRLVEVVACRRTAPEVLDGMTALLRRRLGKGVVRGKDTPNFVANRIGVYSMCNGFRHMAALGMTVEEVDAVAGPATARPRSALFRLADLVGLDTLFHIAKNTRALLPRDADRDEFTVSPAMDRMVAKGLKGNKTKAGFYKKEKSAGAERTLVYDLAAEDYVEAKVPAFASVAATKGISDPGKRLAAVLAGDDQAAEFTWRNLRDTLLYAFKRIPEIAEDVVAVDDAMKWGFNWELGPFEMLDAIGVPAFVARAKRDGVKVPPALAKIDRFYVERGGKLRYRSLGKQAGWRPVPRPPERLDLAELKKQRGGLVEGTEAAAIVDLGDGVLCLEFQTKMNAIDGAVLEMVERAVARAASDGVGLVVANQGTVFSAGANLAWIAANIRDRKWSAIEELIQAFHRALMRVKCAPVPVVSAPHGVALGGGAEICLQSAGIAPHAELSMGLVEVGVGLLPAGGGTKEMALRAIRLADEFEAEVTPFVTKNFRLIAMAKTSGSAAELREMGMLRQGDAVTLDLDALVFSAKQRVLGMAPGYRPVAPARDLKAPGRSVAASLVSSLWNLRMGGFISEYDERLGKAVAGVITGGDVAAGTLVDEDWFLDLEHEAFLSLCGEAMTLARIEHMLKTGKPLRN